MVLLMKYVRKQHLVMAKFQILVLRGNECYVTESSKSLSRKDAFAQNLQALFVFSTFHSFWHQHHHFFCNIFAFVGKEKGPKGCTILINPQIKDAHDLNSTSSPTFILFKSGKKDKSGITSFLNPYLNLKSKWKSVNEKVWNTPIKLPFCTIINLNSNKATTIIHLQWALCNIIGQVQGTIRKKEKVNE